MKSTLVISVLCCVLPGAQQAAEISADEVPLRPAIALPAEDIALIVASAVEHFPELAMSPGIRTADYLDPDSGDSVAAIFWPYERVGDIAYSLLVECRTVGGGQAGWICDQAEPRSYLSIAEQNAAVVIRGPIGREKAVALLEFAKLRLQDETFCIDMNQSEFLTVDPPTPRRDAYRIVWADGASGVIVFQVKEMPQDADPRLELVRVSRSPRHRCGM